MQIHDRAGKIKLLLMDCDGVLTDGRLYFSEEGEELKVFHVRDGLGLVRWHEAGFKSGIVSGRSSTIVEIRARELGIEFVRQASRDKFAAVVEIMEFSGVSADEVAFVGDDLPDIPAMHHICLGIAVADAVDEVRSAAQYVTHAKGGEGAIREVIDLLLDAKKD